MAKKNHTPPPKVNPATKKPAAVQKQAAKPVARPQAAGTAKPVSAGSDRGDGFLAKYANLLIPGAIGLLTFLFFSSCLKNQLTNWDDLGYIITDPLIKDQSPDWLKNIFSVEHPVMGNYHPLTILLYALEYHKYGLAPWIYHFDSVILHVLCTIAVYFFIKTLTGRVVAATVVALLFGLHPMHVESVAWAAGRKDVLYGLFFVLSCTAYLRYIRAEGSKRTMWYISVLVLFAISLLAKSVAVTLPVTLFAIDYLEKRKLNVMLFAEKAPHFALSLLFGILSIKAQKDIGALASLDASFTVVERIALGGYALCTYLWKAIIPVGLSNFYPYPLKVSDALPATYYVFPVIILGLAFVVWRFARNNRAVLFGLAFFVINIFLLLQFLPVGGAIVSDRYGYIPYIGLFFIAGWFVSEYFETKGKLPIGKIALGIAVVYSMIMGFLSYERCKDWYDSVSLWKDDIEKHPEAPVGYFYLGQEYFSRFEKSAKPEEKKAMGDSALAMFNMSIQRKPDYVNPIICVAELQRSYNQVDAAKETYYRALKIDKKSESAYLGLGVVYSIKASMLLAKDNAAAQQLFDSAGYCFRTALALKPYSPEGHSNYANYFDITGRLDSSLNQYAISIQQNPDQYIPYMNRARIFMRQNKFDDAIKDLNLAMQRSPETGDLYYLRAKCLAQKGNKAQAMQDVQAAQSRGFTQVDPNFVNGLK